MKRTKELAKRLGVIGICEFTGNIPHKEIPEILNKMDVYVALSRRESFGVAVLEASACGIPVVVSDAGGLPEVVEDGKTGIVVPKEDVVVAAKALVKLYENRSYARELGVNGRNRVKQKYSWHQSLGIMEDVYKKVLANN
jgi:glycosyltransferase involved in cell wall biosynthesis